jgi:hypothetical protein
MCSSGQLHPYRQNPLERNGRTLQRYPLKFARLAQTSDGALIRRNAIHLNSVPPLFSPPRRGRCKRGISFAALRTNFFRRAQGEFQGSEMLATIFSSAIPITSFYNGPQPLSTTRNFASSPDKCSGIDLAVNRMPAVFAGWSLITRVPFLCCAILSRTSYAMPDIAPLATWV